MSGCSHTHAVMYYDSHQTKNGENNIKIIKDIDTLLCMLNNIILVSEAVGCVWISGPWALNTLDGTKLHISVSHFRATDILNLH